VQACFCQKVDNSAGCAGWQSQEIQVVGKGLSEKIVAMHIIHTH